MSVDITETVLLQGERDKYKLLYESSQQAMSLVFHDYFSEPKQEVWIVDGNDGGLGGVYLNANEVQILNALLDGYTAGPIVQKVLNKLKGNVKKNEAI